MNSWSSLGPPCVSKPLIFVTKRAGSANRQIDLCNDGRGPGWPNSIQNLDQSVSQSVKVVSLSDGVRVASLYLPCCSTHAKSSSSFDCKNFLRKFFTVTVNLQETANHSYVFSESLSITLWRNNGLHISCITPLSAQINASKFQNSSKIPLKIPGVWKNRGDQSLATIS